MPWNLFTHRPGSWKSSVGLFTTAETLWTRLSSLCGSSVVGSSFKSIALGNLNSWWNELILPLIKLTRRGICQLACHNLPRCWMMATFEFDRIQWVIKTDFTQGWNLKWWDGKSTWNLMVVKHHCHGKMMELLTILKAKKCFWQLDCAKPASFPDWSLVIQLPGPYSWLRVVWEPSILDSQCQ